MNNDQKWNYRDKLYVEDEKERMARVKYFKDLNDGVIQGPRVDDEVNDEIWKEQLGKSLFSTYLNEGKVDVEVLNIEYSGPHFDDKDFHVYYDCMQHELLEVKDVFGNDISFKQKFLIGTANDVNGEPPKNLPASVEPHYELYLSNLAVFCEVHNLLEKGASIDSVKEYVDGRDISITPTSEKTK